MIMLQKAKIVQGINYRTVEIETKVLGKEQIPEGFYEEALWCLLT